MKLALKRLYDKFQVGKTIKINDFKIKKTNVHVDYSSYFIYCKVLNKTQNY